MLYRIATAHFESYLVRATLASVMAEVRRKAWRFPIGQEFKVLRGDKLVATSRVEFRISE